MYLSRLAFQEVGLVLVDVHGFCHTRSAQLTGPKNALHFLHLSVCTIIIYLDLCIYSYHMRITMLLPWDCLHFSWLLQFGWMLCVATSSIVQL